MVLQDDSGLVMAIQDKTVLTIDYRTQEKNIVFDCKKSMNFHQISKASNANYVAVSSLEGIVRTFDVRYTRHAVNSFEMPKEKIQSLKICNNDMLVMGYKDRVQVMERGLKDEQTYFTHIVRSSKRGFPRKIIDGY